MKFQIAFAFVALFACAFASNATWGIRNGNDVLLLNDLVFRAPISGYYATADVNFPRPGQTNNRTITAIYVIDRIQRNGATPNLWSGGPGYKFATVNFKSQYGQPINSTVQIYGR